MRWPIEDYLLDNGKPLDLVIGLNLDHGFIQVLHCEKKKGTRLNSGTGPPLCLGTKIANHATARYPMDRLETAGWG